MARPLTDRQREIRSERNAANFLFQRQTFEKRRQLADKSSARIIDESSGLSRSRLEHRERRQTNAEREQARATERIRIVRESEPLKTKEYYKRHVGTRVVTAAGSAARPVVNPVFLIIGTMAALVIFYDLATAGKAQNDFFTSIGSFLSKLSSTAPLYTQVPASGLPTTSGGPDEKKTGTSNG